MPSVKEVRERVQTLVSFRRTLISMLILTEQELHRLQHMLGDEPTASALRRSSPARVTDDDGNAPNLHGGRR